MNIKSEHSRIKNVVTITKIVEVESRTNNISISEKTGRSIFHYVKSLRTIEGRVFRGNGIYFLAGNARDKTATFRRDFNPVSIPRAARPLTVSKQLEEAVVYVYIYTEQPRQICPEHRSDPCFPRRQASYHPLPNVKCSGINGVAISVHNT